MAVRRSELAHDDPSPGVGGVVVRFHRRGARGTFRRILANAAFGAVVALSLAVGLASVGPRFLPYQVLPVLTGSMEPGIPTGALILVTAVGADELRVGDVITFQHPLQPRAYVTHRIVSIEQDGS